MAILAAVKVVGLTFEEGQPEDDEVAAVCEEGGDEDNYFLEHRASERLALLSSASAALADLFGIFVDRPTHGA